MQRLTSERRLSPLGPDLAVSAAADRPSRRRNCPPRPLWHDRGMPSPLGHALGGLAAGCLVAPNAAARTLAVLALVAMLPDLDLLLPMTHRGPTHSIGAAAVAFVVALLVRGHRPLGSRTRVAAAVAAAYFSHVALDWLGADRWPPRGIMVFWPFSSVFYVSDLDLFNRIERRYWLPEFWRGNAIALSREVAILGPIAWVAWRRRRTPGTRQIMRTSRIPGRSFGRGDRRRPSA
jgi:hypothetical protein